MTFENFLGPIELKIACTHRLFSRIHMNSTHQQAKAIASRMFNKRVTRSSLKLLALPPTSLASDRSTKNNVSSSDKSTNNSKSKRMKSATSSSSKKKFQRRTYSRSKKEKGMSIQRVLKRFSKRAASIPKIKK